MPYKVKVHFEKPYSEVTVTNGHYPYLDKNGLKLENLNVAAGAMYEISAALINGAGTVIVYVTDGTARLRFRYAIPNDSDYDGNIYAPKTEAVSKGDFDKLTDEVNALKERIGP
ncbi:hypothetical protein [Rhizobium leguminosarum]|uniref:hypothetical protein n=1 Tax=Rhizobium leguminosarum TaxID=384 RepID=UPI001E17DC21|nr:hypothetical protein [Rhizobium leguminosarum]MBP2448866.1 ABC-type uncharacterized transport system substrate-binding protein [Rhizobium leguminosarum]